MQTLSPPGAMTATASTPAPISTTRRWAGRVISGLVVLFMGLDGVIKVLQLAPAVETTTQLGYPEALVLWIGVLELACLAVYLAPRTAVLGAILLTGFLGGAVATNVRAVTPLFNILFPVIMAALLWGGLALRDRRVRALLADR